MNISKESLVTLLYMIPFEKNMPHCHMHTFKSYTEQVQKKCARQRVIAIAKVFSMDT